VYLFLRVRQTFLEKSPLPYRSAIKDWCPWYLERFSLPFAGVFRIPDSNQVVIARKKEEWPLGKKHQFLTQK
jgi:hypothetical protein